MGGGSISFPGSSEKARTDELEDALAQPTVFVGIARPPQQMLACHHWRRL
jgi:hypothetical protein